MNSKRTRAFGTPGKYIQGPGEIKNLFVYISAFGQSVLTLIDPFFYNSVKNEFEKVASELNLTICIEKFGGRSTETEVERLTQIARKKKLAVMVGMGGGKAMDTAKAVADNLGLFLIIVPTTASMDAPCSALAVIDKADGKGRDLRFCKKNPDLVLVDTEIIAKAPVRFLAAGMGDALATYFEAQANEATDSANYIASGFRRTKLAMSAAKLCYDIILQDGLRAKLSVEAGICTEALENVIEANILLSGLGFENTGCAGAHSVSAGISYLEECHGCLHGEKVAFGLLCQLVIENKPMALIDDLMDFYHKIGLPITLKDLGVAEVTREKVHSVAKGSLNQFWGAEPFTVTEDLIADAILLTDKLGSTKN